MHKMIFPLAIAVILGGIGAAFAGNDLKTTIAVRADGTCEIKAETKQPRAMVEREVKMWLR